MNKKKQFYTSEDVAKILDYNVMTIYRYIKAGKLKAYKMGKEFRIKKEDVDIFLDQHKIDDKL
ncbi:MAG: helix-turn-helix domain-containing protein [Bacteroidales bacterium]|nr:helix-turn-helix domain-containing protein [Bacteroidales bacterium]